MEKKGIMNNFVWKYMERLCAQLVSLVVSVILARILLPEEYGIIAIVNVFITIADVFVNNGLGQALIQKRDTDDLDYSSTFFINFLISIIIFIALFFSAPLISIFYSNCSLIPIIRVMGIRVIIASFNSIQQAYVAKKMEFRKFFFSTFFGTVISGIVGIILAYLGYGVWALVAQYMTNTCIDTLVLFFTCGWRLKLMFSITRVRSLVSYGWKILFESLSDTIVNQIRNLVIGKVYSSESLAFYTKGQQFPDLIMNNLGSTVSAVLFPAMSNVNDNKERMKWTMRNSICLLSYVLFPLLAFMVIVAPTLVRLILTDKWIEAVPFMRVYCVNLLLAVGLHPRHQSLKAIGRSDIYLIEHIPYRIINIILLILVLNNGPMAIMVSSTVATVISCLITMYTSKKYTSYQFKEQFQDLKNSVILTIIMVICIIPLSQIQIHKYIIMFIQIILGALVYCLASKLLKVKEYEQVKMCIREIVKKRK